MKSLFSLKDSTFYGILLWASAVGGWVLRSQSLLLASIVFFLFMWYFHNKEKITTKIVRNLNLYISRKDATKRHPNKSDKQILNIEYKRFKTVFDNAVKGKFEGRDLTEWHFNVHTFWDEPKNRMTMRVEAKSDFAKMCLSAFYKQVLEDGSIDMDEEWV